MTEKKVGQFTMDMETHQLTGPAAYIQQRLHNVVNDCEKGHNFVFSEACEQGKDAVTALLVALQTDYAAWRGMRDMLEPCMSQDEHPYLGGR